MKKETRTNSDFLTVAEFRLLNGLIHNVEWINDSRIHTDIFIHSSAKSLFTAVKAHIDRGIAISESSLFQEANAIDYAIDQGVVKYVLELDNDEASLDHILDVLNRGVQKSNLKKLLDEMTESVNSHDMIDTANLSNGLSTMTEVLNNTYDKSILISTDEWTDAYYEELINRRNGKLFSFGDALLDRALPRKAAPGQFILVAGATGTGKSAYALSLVSGFINLNIPSIYITLEMSGEASMDRLFAMRSDIPVSEMYNHGDDMIPIIDKFRESRKDIDSARNFFMVEDPNLSLSHIESLIREFKQRTGNEYCLVVIDLITMVKDFQEGSGASTLASTIEMGINRLNALCKSENVCIVGIAQFSRKADDARVTTIEELELLRPQLNHVKNSQALAERARVVLSVFRPRYYATRYLQHIPEIEEMEDVMQVQVLKNSQGSVGKMLNYLFDGTVFQITPIEDEQPSD